MSNAKPYEIPKRLVWNAWLAVKANRGAAGVDGQTIDDFEANLEKGLYKIWNRMRINGESMGSDAEVSPQNIQ